MLTTSRLIEVLESAFRPLICRARLFDGDQKVGFRVTDAKDNGVLRCDSTTVVELLNEHILLSHVRTWRGMIEEKGNQLEPFVFEQELISQKQSK